MFDVLLLSLIIGMGSTVLGFAARSLRHEPYQRRFTAVGAMLVAAGSVLVLSGNLIVITASWIATSWLAVALIRTGPSAGVWERSARARRSFAIGDVALVAAVATMVSSTGSTAVADLDQAGPLALGVAGVLAVVAAASRSASGPFFRWLPDSLGAPTPSSALLHAGVVNGGALLLIKLAPATAETLPAAMVALVIGGASCAFAEAVMLTRPDVKGRLAWSTIAQMSFTMVLCGLGLHVAAGLHLVAHGFYKGALFLGSGSTVRQTVRHHRAPAGSGGRHPGAFVLAGTVAGATLWATGAEVHADLAVPAGLACVATGCAVQAWMRRSTTTRERLAAATAGAALLITFLLVTLGFEGIVKADLAVGEPSLSAWWVLPVLAALGAVALAPRNLAAWKLIRAAGRPATAPRLTVPGPLAWRPGASAPVRTRPALDHLGV
jgi:NAD(P)H-quinone oxidoreductase subunit 5